MPRRSRSRGEEDRQKSVSPIRPCSIPPTLTKPQRTALVSFWHAWHRRPGNRSPRRSGLRQRRVSDRGVRPAVRRVPARRKASSPSCTARPSSTFDKTILQHNLYGVDLNGEAVEIARLSCWIKTAEVGKVLTSLDHNIRVGNSVVADPAVHPKAFDWKAAFPEVFAAGGFDVVIGNPPYVRQEWISPFKPYLQQHYRAYDGVADLYVYFYELGVNLLKPGGRLGFVVTNKWMKAGYGEPLRRLFGESRLGGIGGGLRPRQADLPGRRRVSVDPRGPQADRRAAASVCPRLRHPPRATADR